MCLNVSEYAARFKESRMRGNFVKIIKKKKKKQSDETYRNKILNDSYDFSTRIEI